MEEKSVGGTPNQVEVLLQQSLEDCTRASEAARHYFCWRYCETRGLHLLGTSNGDAPHPLTSRGSTMPSLHDALQPHRWNCSVGPGHNSELVDECLCQPALLKPCHFSARGCTVLSPSTSARNSGIPLLKWGLVRKHFLAQVQ